LEDLREEIKGGENILEKLMRKIPGFEGYKNREQARNADQIQRIFMAKSVRDLRAKLSDVGQEMIRSGNIMLIAEVDRVSKLFDKASDRIEHAEYGYSALFSSTKVDEEKLDTLYEYDLGMLINLDSLSEAVLAMENSIEMEGGDPKARLRDLERAVKALDQKIDGRQKLLKGVD
jgi:hypothetical protein